VTAAPRYSPAARVAARKAYRGQDARPHAHAGQTVGRGWWQDRKVFQTFTQHPTKARIVVRKRRAAVPRGLPRGLRRYAKANGG